eukprot:COSAG06_NODE_37070_length_439_cov_2.076471_1_plen_50_part_10
MMKFALAALSTATVVLGSDDFESRCNPEMQPQEEETHPLLGSEATYAAAD